MGLSFKRREEPRRAWRRGMKRGERAILRDKSGRHCRADGKVASAISGQWEGILEDPVEWKGSAAVETNSKIGPGTVPGVLIMMAVEGSTITSRLKNLLRSPSIKLRRSKAGNRREDLSSKVSPSIGSHPFPTLPCCAPCSFSFFFGGWGRGELEAPAGSKGLSVPTSDTQENNDLVLG